MSIKYEIKKIQENAREIKRLADEIMTDRKKQLDTLQKPSVPSVEDIFDKICDFSSAHSKNGYRFRATCFTDKYDAKENQEDAVKKRMELAQAIHNLITGGK